MAVPIILARLVLAGAALTAATAAGAAVVVDTFTGSVIAPQEYTNIIQDTDGLNLFGGGSLAGDTFQAVVTTNTALAAITQTPTGADYLDGGSAYAGPAYNSVVLTLYAPGGGALGSVAFAGAYLGRSSYFDAAIAGYNTSSIGSVVGVQTGSTAEIFSAGAPVTAGDVADFPASFTSSGGYLSNDMGSYFYLQTSGGTTGVSLGTTCLTSGAGTCPAPPPPPPPPPPPAPEPGAWALMLMGIGAVGGALRQRRRLPA